MNFLKKSQSSLEFLSIFLIGFTIIIIMSGIFFNYTSEAKQSLDKSQIDKIGNDIISNIENIYFIGQGNKITMKAKFPDYIENFTIHHTNNTLGEKFDYLNFTIQGEKIFTNQLFLTKELYIRFNCSSCYHNNITNISYYNSSDFSGGLKVIKIESRENYVTLDFVK